MGTIGAHTAIESVPVIVVAVTRKDWVIRSVGLINNKIMEQPNTLQEAIELINPMFDGMENYFEATKDNPVKGMILSVYDEDSFATFCHSQLSGAIGMKIRNHFKFWGDNKSPLYLDLKNNHNCKDPDAMSDKIVRGVYKLRTEPA